MRTGGDDFEHADTAPLASFDFADGLNVEVAARVDRSEVVGITVLRALAPPRSVAAGVE